MVVRALNHRRTRPLQRTLRGRAWGASLLLHGVAAAVAWAVTAPVRYESSQLIGQSTRVELAATMAHSEFSRPNPAPEEVALPVRIMPSEAAIARRHFHVESTSVAEPTPFERELVDRLLARPASSRRLPERSEPTLAAQPANVLARQAAVSPLAHQPGTADHPLPELIQSPPPAYPQIAIERRWEGTVLLRLNVTREGRVGSVVILRGSGHDVLDGEAVRAVRAWRFVPAIRDGQSVPTAVRLPVRFELSARTGARLSAAR